MTTAYWNEAEYLKNLGYLFKEKKDPSRGNSYIETHSSSYRSCAPFTMAARLVRYHSTQYKLFKTLLTNALRDCGVPYSVEEVLKGMPLIIPSKDVTKLRVYVNVPLDRPEDDMVENVCWIISEETLQSLYETYTEEIKHPHKAVGWDTTPKVWKKIKKFEEMPIQRVISRYTRLTELKVKESTIAAVGADIAEQRKPLELTYIKSADQSFEMYGSGQSSCMDHRVHNPEAWRDMQKVGLHPTSFFHFHPYVTGVYAIQKGVVVARTYLYEYENGKKAYGRIYSTTPKHHQVFENNLRALGHTKLGADGNGSGFSRQCTFTIPGAPSTTHPGAYYMPMPYCDNLVGNIKVSFDREKKEFTVVCCASGGNVQNQSAQGWVSSDQLEIRECRACNRRIPAGTRAIVARDNNVFCSTDHARSAGYVHAYRDDGERVWIIRDENVVEDCYERNICYTNQAAALRRGLFPVMETLGEEVENDQMMTATGVLIRRKGELFKHFQTITHEAMAQWEEAVRSGHIRQTAEHDKWGNTIFDWIEEEHLSISIKQQKVVEFDDEIPFTQEVAA